MNAVGQREYQILESLREIKFNAQSIAWTPPPREVLFRGLLSTVTGRAFVVLHAEMSGQRFSPTSHAVVLFQLAWFERDSPCLWAAWGE